MHSIAYPDAVNPSLVGTYSAHAKAGGGFVWDDVLEYRVWCHPEDGSDDYCYSFVTYTEALAFSKRAERAQEPLALIRQREYIDERNPGEYLHIKEERITEWPVEFLLRPRRTKNTIPDFLSPNAPPNRLDILRGIAK